MSRNVLIILLENVLEFLNLNKKMDIDQEMFINWVLICIKIAVTILGLFRNPSMIWIGFHDATSFQLHHPSTYFSYFLLSCFNTIHIVCLHTVYSLHISSLSFRELLLYCHYALTNDIVITNYNVLQKTMSNKSRNCYSFTGTALRGGLIMILGGE